ncbi:MAG: hypothetical protein FIA92_12320, partial [Chloroflexi bacterium]|nr:hypothetical protein [Chloroflexota bacterium]
MARRASASSLAAALVAWSLAAALVAGATKPVAWIDQPLPGSVLPLGPTSVTIHAASDVGIAKVRLLGDGIPVGELPAPPGDLVTLDWTWVPPAPGIHLLTVVADGTDGSPSDPVSVAVTFLEGDGPAPTAPPS